MSIINPIADAYPYLVLIAICLIAVLVVFWKYPPIRAFRRKRNLLFYAFLLLSLFLLVYQAYTVSLGPNYVSFSIEKTDTPIYAQQQNHFSVTCTSDGAKDIHFYMVIRSSNATLQTVEQQGYIQLNSTAIKIPFNFHGSGTQTKPVYFTADANVSSLAFIPSVERQKDSPMLVWVYLSEIQCTYNPATNTFTMTDSYPIPVP